MTDGRRMIRQILSRRSIFQTASVVGLLVILAACGGSDDATSPEDAGIQLVYQDWRNDWFPPMAQRMLEQFHAENPGIRVFYTPDPQGFSQTMLADMQAGTAPDVFWGCCTFFPIWAQQGFAVDLTPFVESDLEQGEPSMNGTKLNTAHSSPRTDAAMPFPSTMELWPSITIKISWTNTAWITPTEPGTTTITWMQCRV